MLTPAPLDQWGRRGFQFTVPGLIFNIKLDHKDWPLPVQSFVLNQTPNWLSGGVAYWGETAWRMMKLAAAKMQERRPRAKPSAAT